MAASYGSSPFQRQIAFFNRKIDLPGLSIMLVGLSVTSVRVRLDPRQCAMTRP